MKALPPRQGVPRQQQFDAVALREGPEASPRAMLVILDLEFLASSGPVFRAQAPDLRHKVDLFQAPTWSLFEGSQECQLKCTI